MQLYNLLQAATLATLATQVAAAPSGGLELPAEFSLERRQCEPGAGPCCNMGPCINGCVACCITAGPGQGTCVSCLVSFSYLGILSILPTCFDGCVLVFHCIRSLVLLGVVYVVGVVFFSFFLREGWFETLVF